MEMEDAVRLLTTGPKLGIQPVGRATRCFFSDFQKNLNNLPLQARAAHNRQQLRSWMRMLKAMAALSWSKMTILEVKTLDHNFGQCLFFHPLMVPWDRR
jgi:ABC-type phosphate/phosphonate transport system permease subunit